MYGIADPGEVGDPIYVEGLRGAASAAVDFALEALEASQERLPLLPPTLLAQARLAARSGIGIDTVMRRYVAGHAIFLDLLVEEAERPLPPAELRRILAINSAAFDRLLVAVGEEHARELEACRYHSRELRKAELVRRLLAGEPIDAAELSYDLAGWHVGIVARDAGIAEQVHDFAASLGCRSLVLSHHDGQVWAWLGAREPLDPSAIAPFADALDAPVLALGEPAEGLPGWRLTHRQASAALTVAARRGRGAARYADVALIAAVLENDLLRDSLHSLYLEPITRERDGGAVLRSTLEAYFEAEGNVSSTAAALGVSRRTVRDRLHRVEQLTGRRHGASAELQLALRMHEYL